MLLRVAINEFVEGFTRDLKQQASARAIPVLDAAKADMDTAVEAAQTAADEALSQAKVIGLQIALNAGTAIDTVRDQLRSDGKPGGLKIDGVLGEKTQAAYQAAEQELATAYRGVAEAPGALDEPTINALGDDATGGEAVAVFNIDDDVADSVLAALVADPLAGVEVDDDGEK